MKKSASPAARRRVAVLVSLIGVLSFTSALLLALAPAPLNPQATSSLFAVDAPQSFDVLFDSTATPIQKARWQYVYIHHSKSVAGTAQTLSEPGGDLADHFVIGNGDGCADGEIQIGQRWSQQQAAGRTPGADWIRPDCISICLVGDFNQTRPTATQERRLVQLVQALQDRLHIPATNVRCYPQTATAAGIGPHFPSRDFYAQVLP
jgi:hypothetical protein